MRRYRVLFALLAVAAAQAEPVNPRIIERYKQMLAANPAEGTALDRLWTAALDQNQTGQLLAEYQAGQTFASQMVLGHLLRKAGRPDEAGAAYERAGKLNANSPLPFLALAKLRVDQGKTGEAAASFEKAAALLPSDDPQHADVLTQLGAAWLAAGDANRALEAWERIITQNPNDLALRRRVAETCLEHQLPQRAIPHLQKLVEAGPPQERAQALQQLARVYQGAGDQDEAIRSLEKALTFTAPGNWLRADLQSQLIRLHQRYHRTAELEEKWTKAVQQSPRDLGGYLQLIDLYERTGDLEHQRQWLEKLVGLAPKSIPYRLKLARLLAQMDDPRGAGKRYDELLAEQPNNVELTFERARLDVQMEAVDAARKRVQALVAAKKDDESVRGMALEFFETHRLYDLVEAQLSEDALRETSESLVALATFYFTQNRPDDGRRTLQRLIKPKAVKEEQAAAYYQIAQILKAQSDLTSAADALKKGLELVSTRDAWLLLGDIRAALGGNSEARAAYEQAFAQSQPGTEQYESDQKIFDTFRNPAAIRSASEGPISRPLVDTEGAPQREESQMYVLKIIGTVTGSPSVDGWLRVARWYQWLRNRRLAQEYAGRALALDPDSIAAHEFLVKLNSADPQSVTTRNHLQELMRIDPAHRTEYKRRTGQLELQTGRLGEAERIFQEIVQSNPGNIDALTDLALTLQREEKWPESLATWKQIYALTPVARKKDVIGSLLRVYDQLNLHAKAAELLLEHVDGATEEKERFATFQDLLNLCSKHALLDWLQDQMAQRRKVHADDYFTEMAYGRVLKMTGHKSEAFEILADASFAAPNQAEALPELVREAEELRKIDAAIRLQSQLVRMIPQTRPDGLEKLAQLQEKNLEISPASATWDRVVAKFPRDAAVLEHAAEFQSHWGASRRAADLFRKIRSMEPGNVRVLSRLAQIDLESGDNAEAQQCLEQILVRTPPEKAGDPLRFPGVKSEDASQLQTTYLNTVRQRRGRPAPEAIRALRMFWSDSQSGDKDRIDVRRGAIRDLARLIQLKGDSGELKRWVDRWSKAGNSPGETAWALYYAGANTALLDHLEGLMTKSPADAQIKQAFLWLGLQTREFQRLNAWMEDRRRTPVERDYLLVALSQYLQSSQGKSDPDLVRQLFPTGFRFRLWQAAALFASRGYFREATELGHRVFTTLSTQRPAYALELAHWHLYLGEIEKARQVLRESIDIPAESLDAPVFAALREYYLLLPEKERASFAEWFVSELDENRRPLHSALSRALLAGLAGHDEEAQPWLNRVLQLGAIARQGTDEPGNSGTRYWDFVRVNGAQLQSWKLNGLAIRLWKGALTDEALLRLRIQTQGDEVQSRAVDVRTRMTSLQLLRSSSFEAEEIIEQYSQHAVHDNLTPLGEGLESVGAFPQAIEIYHDLWERDPQNGQLLRCLITACRTASDYDTLEEVLSRCVEEGYFRSNDPVHRDLALQLAEVLSRRGAAAQSLQILDTTASDAPADVHLLQRLGQSYEKAGRVTEAEAMYRRMLGLEPSSAGTRVLIATMLEKQGRMNEGIEILEKSGGIEVDTKLAQLYLKADRLDEAVAALERIPNPSHVAATLLFADTLNGKGERKEACRILRQAIRRTPDPRVSFPLQSKIIELVSPDDDDAVIPREVRWLRQMAGDQSDLVTGYFDLMIHQATRLKIESQFVQELKDNWDDGEGLLTAGSALLEWSLLQKDFATADNVVTRLLARDDADEAILQRTVALLENGDLPERLIQASQRLARLAPVNYQYMLDWARVLQRHGREKEAVAVLDEVAYRGALNDEIAGKTARLFAEFKQLERARILYAQAIAGDPTVRYPETYRQYASLLTELGRYPEARRVFRASYRNPANREFNELITLLAVTGRLERFDAELPEFDLSPKAVLTAHRALFGYWEARKNAAAAAALLSEHPETYDSTIPKRLSALAKAAGVFDGPAQSLERILNQSPLETHPEIEKELAGIYGEWAEADLARIQTESALAHLVRGRQLQPDDLVMTLRLAELYVERGDPKRAIDVLQDFLANSKNPAERERARQMLTRLHPA